MTGIHIRRDTNLWLGQIEQRLYGQNWAHAIRRVLDVPDVEARRWDCGAWQPGGQLPPGAQLTHRGVRVEFR